MVMGGLRVRHCCMCFMGMRFTEHGGILGNVSVACMLTHFCDFQGSGAVVGLHCDHGLIILSLHCLQHERWRLSSVNRDYLVCPSYPPAVIVPHSIDDDTLKKAAKFRQGGRFPVLCYYHRKNGMVRCFNFHC